MYVRKKKVKGREYFYLVRSKRVGDVVRQECLKYLGAELPTKRRLERIKKKFEKA